MNWSVQERVRPRIPRTLALVAVSIALSCAGDAQRASVDPADLVLRGGRVVTVDEGLPEAQAVAVRGAYIVGGPR